MDCGIPFCNNGCPLGNLIPDWNDLVYRDLWRDAVERLHATNNFPEFTGRLCPAPCETACVLGINADPVTIKQVEVEIIDRAWAEGWVTPRPPTVLTGKRVAVIGSGPAGLAVAQQLTRAGHEVVVLERADRIGGLLRYGIPEFKMEKRHLDRRAGPDAGRGHRVPDRCRRWASTSTWTSSSAPTTPWSWPAGPRPGATCPSRAASCTGSTRPWSTCRWGNRVQQGDLAEPPITAAGKHVIIIGGGDTGADCLGTVHRQGRGQRDAAGDPPRPPDTRNPGNPWPQWSLIYRTTSAHEEGGERLFSVNTERFVDDGSGRVRALRLHEVCMVDGRFERVEGTDHEIPADLVLLAMGFVGPDRGSWLDQLGVAFDERSNVARNDDFMTNVPGVFVAGDMGRGQSLIVWAIAEGRACAAGVDRWLMGETRLPAPILPTTRPLV